MQRTARYFERSTSMKTMAAVAHKCRFTSGTATIFPAAAALIRNDCAVRQRRKSASGYRNYAPAYRMVEDDVNGVRFTGDVES